jgi:outer membrane protein OmpA-like peptidoglycan-associated protein
MSFNLLELVKSHFSTEMVSKVASSLGESEGGISKAIAAIVPTVLSGVAGKAASASGASDIFSMASSALGGGDMATKGIDIVKGLFGGNETKVAEQIAASSGVQASTVTHLMETAAPVAMSAIGGHAKESGLDASGLAGMLSSNLGEWTKMLPEGLGSLAGFAGLAGLGGAAAAVSGISSNVASGVSDVVSSVSSSVSGATSNITSAASSSASAAHDRVTAAIPTVPEGKGAVRFLLPALLAIAAIFGLYYFMTGKDKAKEEHGGGHNADIHAKDASHATEETHVYDPNYKVSGKLEGGEYSYDLGEEKVIILDNKAGGKDTMKVGKYSTEYRLYSFLHDKNAMLDTAKGNWFDFTNVRFKTGSSDVTDASMLQLENLAKLAHHFKNAKFKIGGYTDNVGAEAANTALSQKRAEAVSTLLTTKLGISKDVITGAKGFGPQYPVGDNATPEGKAMNRRVSVNVKAK